MKRILDIIDEHILAELSANSKQSHADIAATVGLSRNAVRQRIERLERDGVIQGYTIRTNRGQGNGSISAVVFVYRQDRMRGTGVLESLRKIPEVTQCEVLSGEFDVVVRIVASDSENIHQVWNQIAAIPGVENTVTSFVLSSEI